MKLLWVIVLFAFSCVAVDVNIQLILSYKEGDRYFYSSDSLGNLVVNDLYEIENDSRFDAEKDVDFRLYTRKNPGKYQSIVYNDLNSLLMSNYEAGKAVKVIFHGWNADSEGNPCYMLRDSFLRVVDANVICVEWSAGSNVIYTTAVRNVAKTAAFTTKMLEWLIRFGSKPADFHLMGHSLGAHVCGFTGRSMSSGSISYITGFDPALPLWGETSDRIGPDDADYVEIIHTNGGVLGLLDAVGHNDFYPNGGKSMPGCSIINLACSHSRAAAYFSYSLDAERFEANQCVDYDEISEGKCSNITKMHMGGLYSKKARGVFYLVTGAKPPYYLD